MSQEPELKYVLHNLNGETTSLFYISQGASYTNWSTDKIGIDEPLALLSYKYILNDIIT